MSKKILLSGYIGFSNFGDDVLHEVLISHLKKLDCKITALSSNPKLTEETFGIKSFYYKDLFKVISSIFKTDILIFSGGNLLQNETSNLSLFYYLFIAICSKIFFKKTVFYSNGIGPIDGFLQNLLTKIVLKTADFVSVRDEFSIEYLKNNKITGELTVDGLWELKVPEYCPKNLIGIQLRDYKNIAPDLYEKIAELISKNLPEYEVEIFSLQNKQDIAECEKFQTILNKINPNIVSKIIPYETPKKLSEEFSKLKYLIGMRYHANMLGLKLGVKILPISYSIKVTNLAKDFGIEYIKGEETSNLDSAFHNLIDEKFTIKPALKNYEWQNIDKIINN